jgi:hypothetical protein
LQFVLVTHHHATTTDEINAMGEMGGWKITNPEEMVGIVSTQAN